MKKLFVKYLKGEEHRYACIPADKLYAENGFIFSQRGESLVGAFDLGVVYAIYISEEGKNER